MLDPIYGDPIGTIMVVAFLLDWNLLHLPLIQLKYHSHKNRIQMVTGLLITRVVYSFAGSQLRPQHAIADPSDDCPRDLVWTVEEQGHFGNHAKEISRIPFHCTDHWSFDLFLVS